MNPDDYAYTPNKFRTSTWKLDISDAAHVGGAIAALTVGFRGQKVDIPAADLPAVKAKVIAAWKKFHPDEDPANCPLKANAKHYSSSQGETFLKHYGVLGMHWGVRKSEPNPVGQFVKKHKKGLKITGGVALGVAAAAAVGYGISKSPRIMNAIARVQWKNAKWPAENEADYRTTFEGYANELKWLKTAPLTLAEKRASTAWGKYSKDARRGAREVYAVRSGREAAVLDIIKRNAANNPNLVALNNGWVKGVKKLVR